MIKKWLLVITILLVLSSLFCIDQQRDYFKQVSFIENLGTNFTVTELGSVCYSNVAYPVYKITFNPDSNNHERYLILCGVHGNEPAPVLAIGSFLQQINATKVDINSPCIDFIYILNPWGFTFNQRHNGIDIDINRDISTQMAQESKLLNNAINISDYDYVFDFHEGNTSGYYLYYYSKKYHSIVSKIISMYKENRLPLENEYIDVILKTKHGVIYVPWYAKEYMKIKETLTTTLWSYNKGIDRSFTIETSKNRNIEERITIIIRILQEIVKGSF